MNLKPSRVLARLRQGETVSCVKLNLSDARVAELAALCGHACIWLDLEHVPNTLAVIEQQIRAAGWNGAETIVRVARGSYSDLIRPLELDAAGIMVPHIMSLADAQAVVRQTRFHPVGRRPVDGGNADGGFTMIDFKAYIAAANRERMVIVQIEDPEPMAELDAIAAVEGIDMLFFGPGDFSHALGVPGELNHPRVQEARRRVADAARRHGKFAGTVGSRQNWDELKSLGYRFINVGSDVVGLAAYFRAILPG